jgi:hypothetical protein
MSALGPAVALSYWQASAYSATMGLNGLPGLLDVRTTE